MSTLNEFQLSARLQLERAATWMFAQCGDLLCQLQLLRHVEDPYPVYEQIRARGPLYRAPNGVRMVTSYQLCKQVLRDPRFGVRRANGKLPGARQVSRLGLRQFANSIVQLDSPGHTRVRRLAAPAFRARLIKEHREWIEKITHQLLDQVADKDGFDLITDFAEPLPLAVISRLFGIPDDEIEPFDRYGKIMVRALDGFRSTRELGEFRVAAREFTDLFTKLTQRRRKDPEDDIISILVTAEAEEKITVDELTAMCQLMLVAGFETTTNLIGSGVFLLLEHPEQWALLRENPDLAPQVVEEVLRFEPPAQVILRVSKEETELASQRLPPDVEVLLILAAANRDPDVYPFPHRFDITREGGPEHLAFSSGIHYCLGAQLARMEGDIALRALVERLPQLRRHGQAQRRRINGLRGLQRVPVSAR